MSGCASHTPNLLPSRVARNPKAGTSNGTLTPVPGLPEHPTLLCLSTQIQQEGQERPLARKSEQMGASAVDGSPSAQCPQEPFHPGDPAPVPGPTRGAVLPGLYCDCGRYGDRSTSGRMKHLTTGKQEFQGRHQEGEDGHSIGKQASLSASVSSSAPCGGRVFLAGPGCPRTTCWATAQAPPFPTFTPRVPRGLGPWRRTRSSQTKACTPRFPQTTHTGPL